jgi:hypothetical protein
MLLNSYYLFCKSIIPPFLILIFIIFASLIYLNRRHISRAFSKIKKRTFVLLFLIFVIGLSVRLLIPDKVHRLYTDEHVSMLIGKELLLDGKIGPMDRYIGWSFVIMMLFGVFDVSNMVVLYANVIIGSLSTIIIFFLVTILLDDERMGLWSALIFSVLPGLVLWSTSATDNTASILFTLVCLVFCFLYYRNQKSSLLWLALFSIGFTSIIRVENYALFPIFFVGCLMFDKKPIRFRRYLLPLVLVSLLVMPFMVKDAIVQVSTDWVASDSGGTLDGENWSLSNLIYNTLNFGGRIFTEGVPVIVIALLVVGFVYLLQKKSKKMNEVLFLLVWFAAMYIVHFVFVPTNFMYVIGTMRYYLVFYPVMAILCGNGMVHITDYIRNVSSIKIAFVVRLAIILAVLIGSIGILRTMNTHSAAFRLETNVLELAERDIPKGCAVLMIYPQILAATTDIDAIPIDESLMSLDSKKGIFEKHDCVLFFEDIFCNTKEEIVVDGNKYNKCRLVEKEFQMVSFKQYTEGNEKVEFFRLVGYNNSSAEG